MRIQFDLDEGTSFEVSPNTASCVRVYTPGRFASSNYSSLLLASPEVAEEFAAALILSARKQREELARAELRTELTGQVSA